MEDSVPDWVQDHYFYLDFDISAISLSNFQKCMSSTNMSKLAYKYTVSRKCKSFPDRIIDKWITDLGQGLHVDREFISSAFGLITKNNKTNAQAIPPRRYGSQLHLCRISAI